MDNVVVFLVGALAGAVAAISGFGIGSLLTPVLALRLGTKLAIATVAIPHFVGTLLRLVRLRRFVHRGILLRFGLASAAGGLAGAVLHTILGSPNLEIVFGGLLILAGVSELTGRRIPTRVPWIEGFVSGLFGGLVGNQGGIRSAALLRYDLERRAFVATATAVGLLVDLVRLPIYLATAHTAMIGQTRLIVAASAGVIVGTLLGEPVLRRIPERTFRRTVSLLLLTLGIYMLITGIRNTAMETP